MHIHMYDNDVSYNVWYNMMCVMCVSRTCVFVGLSRSHGIQIRGSFKNRRTKRKKKRKTLYASYEKLLSHFVSQLCAEFMMTMGYCWLGPGGKVAPKQS